MLKLVFHRSGGLLLFISLLLMPLLMPDLSSAQEVRADQWIDDGWAELAKGGDDLQRLDAAILVWQNGVNGLGHDRVLLSPIGNYASVINALHGVNRLGMAMRGIVLKGRYHGEVNYFVLSVPPLDKTEHFRTHFEQLLSGGEHRVLGWSAGQFQQGGSMALMIAEPAVSQDAPQPEVQLPVASVEPPSKPLVIHRRTPPQATPEQQARKLLEMAQAAQAKGDRKQAILLLTELLKRTPDHARARLMSGRLMVEDGQYDAAWQVMAPLLRAENIDWKPWFWSGTAELMTGKLNEAASHFDESLARDGRVAAVWVQRALVAQERGRYAVAYQLLKVAEMQSPKSVQVMLNIGFTLDALGKKTRAIHYYQRYLVQTAGASSQWQARRSVIARVAELSH